MHFCQYLTSNYMCCLSDYIGNLFISSLFWGFTKVICWSNKNLHQVIWTLTNTNIRWKQDKIYYTPYTIWDWDDNQFLLLDVVILVVTIVFWLKLLIVLVLRHILTMISSGVNDDRREEQESSTFFLVKITQLKMIPNSTLCLIVLILLCGLLHC